VFGSFTGEIALENADLISKMKIARSRLAINQLGQYLTSSGS
jgi:hypothetical protein